MYYIKIKDGQGNVIYNNENIETMAEGLEILEREFDKIDNCDDYVVEFNLLKEVILHGE